MRKFSDFIASRNVGRYEFQQKYKPNNFYNCLFTSRFVNEYFFLLVLISSEQQTFKELQQAAFFTLDNKS
jgi:hypothetical protein